LLSLNVPLVKRKAIQNLPDRIPTTCRIAKFKLAGLTIVRLAYYGMFENFKLFDYLPELGVALRSYNVENAICTSLVDDLLATALRMYTNKIDWNQKGRQGQRYRFNHGWWISTILPTAIQILLYARPSIGVRELVCTTGRITAAYLPNVKLPTPYW